MPTEDKPRRPRRARVAAHASTGATTAEGGKSNGNGRRPKSAATERIVGEDRLLRALAATAILSRRETLARLGLSYGTDRDIYTALGYTKYPRFDDYIARYTRQEIAKAIIDVPVRASWRLPPVVSESEGGPTPFEKAWETLAKRLRIWRALSRLDRLAGIGQYAVLLVGFDDSADFSEPVARARRVLYVSPYSEASADIVNLVQDPKDERYGLPLSYRIQMGGTTTQIGLAKTVHWSRVVHVAEDPLESEVYGTPRLQAILNRLQDVELIAGGSSEMFWRGAFPGLGFKMEKDATLGAQSEEDVETEIEEYVHQFRRYLRLRGVEVQQLAPQVADPSRHVQILIDLISSATGIPKRILLGSERGELASTQDQRTWAMHVGERQTEHCEPVILRPLLDRLVKVGVLPKPAKGDYWCKWPDLLLLTKKERAQVGEVMSRAIKNYMLALGGQAIVPPEVFLREFLGFDQAEYDRVTAILAKTRAGGGASSSDDVGGADAPPAPTVVGRGEGNGNGEEN